jgi:hypothetical protein
MREIFLERLQELEMQFRMFGVVRRREKKRREATMPRICSSALQTPLRNTSLNVLLFLY